MPKKRVEKAQKEKRPIAGFVLSIFAFIFCWVPLIGIALGILGIIFSSKGMKSKKRGLPLAGQIISIFSLVLAAVILVAFIIALIVGLSIIQLIFHN